MFCQKCGTQNADDATFCFKCGSKLTVIVQTETKQTIEKPTFIQSNDDSKRIEEVKKEEINVIHEPKKKGSGWKTLFFIIIGLAAIGAIFGNHSETNTVSSQAITSTVTPTPLQTSILVTASPLQMLPIINDMPDGTRKLEDTGNDTYAQRKFAFVGAFSAQTLIYEVNKFSSINDAVADYNSIKDTYSNYKLDDVSIGDEGFGLSKVNGILADIVFRKANVVIKVEFAGYGVTLDDTISYAKLVNTPTSTQVVSSPSDTIVTTSNSGVVANGEIWDAGNGYTLKVMDIDLNTPRTVLIELYKNGNILDRMALLEGKTYTYGTVFIANVNSISDAGVVFGHTKT